MRPIILGVAAAAVVVVVGRMAFGRGAALVTAADIVEIVVFLVCTIGVSLWAGRHDPTPSRGDDDEDRAKSWEPLEVRRLKDEFLATVSHELRTPLNAILGWTELLRSPELAHAIDRDHALAVIERNARREQALVEELLDAAGIVCTSTHQEIIRVEDVLRDVLNAAAPAARAANVALDRTPADPVDAFPPRQVLADSHRLQLALGHIVDNAIKFTRAGGRVRTTVRYGASDVAVEIADTGIGIAPWFHADIFKAFKQQDSSPSRVYPGLGLGLMVARRWIEADGGRVEVMKKATRAGSTFVVTLPARVLPEPPPPESHWNLPASPIP